MNLSNIIFNKQVICIALNLHKIVRYCSNKPHYKRCYEILGIPDNSDQESIRRAYLELVKKYHPDSSEGDLEKFQEIDKAFRTLIDKKSRERWDAEEIEHVTEEYDIKHTAPQHRQYLSYEGMGMGTPFQRQKQYEKKRATQGADNVLKYRIAKVTADEKTLMDKKVPFKHKIKTKYGFDRLVEDLIQESMSKGEFNNLSGCGKPLKTHQNLNPYVDFVTHKINQVLIDNGFTPEWITLQKEIKEEIKLIRDVLQDNRKKFPKCPLSEEDNSRWVDCVNNYKEAIDHLNKKVNHFNLVVPVLNRQMVFFNLNKEADNVLKNGEFGVNIVKECEESTKIKSNEKIGNNLSFMELIFGK